MYFEHYLSQELELQDRYKPEFEETKAKIMSEIDRIEAEQNLRI